jgi:hypothetical protein
VGTAVVLAAALTVGALQPPARDGVWIDGVQLGDLQDCEGPARSGCQELAHCALAAIWEKGPPSIASARIYDPPRPTDGTIDTAARGPIVVFDLADGSQKAYMIRQLENCAPTRSLGQGEYWLPVAWSLFNGTHLCGGGGFVTEPRLRGSPDDPRLVWMVDASGKRIELAWPPGFSVRFTPRLEVLNARGDAVAFDGSRAASGCGTGDENAMYVDFWR